MVRCGEDTVLRRPLSVHQIQNESMALLFQVRGKGTEWLSKQKSGDNLDIFGPMGKGFAVSRQSRNVLLVAGGIGIAPLYYLAETAIKKGCAVTLLIGAATSKQLYPINQLPPGVKIVLATDDGSAGQKGMVTDLIPRHVSSADQVFACGPLPMLKYMAENMKKLGLAGKKVQISLEMRMGCGVGVCYGCTIRTKSGLKQACKA
jgi:dihydroorotate dehydrogenase electron transfer subunit